MVVEFAGGELSSLQPEQPVTADVSLTNAKLLRTYVEALPWKEDGGSSSTSSPKEKSRSTFVRSCSCAARP